MLEAGVRRAEQRLLEFEEKYSLGTQKFISHNESGELEKTVDFDAWIAAVASQNGLKLFTKDIQFHSGVFRYSAIQVLVTYGCLLIPDL